MENKNLGYNAVFEKERQRLGLQEFSVARVVAEYKELYRVKNAGGEYPAKITGKQMFTAMSREDYSVVGDWVVIAEPDKEHAVIRGVLPRQSILKRTRGDKSRLGGKNETQMIVANIDAAFIVESADRDYSLNRLERYIVMAQDGGVQPVVVLSKVDLLTKEGLDAMMVQLKNRFSDIDILATSSVRSDGFRTLKNYIVAGKTYCFLGSSGVGKSSLINRLLGDSVIKTNDISTYSNRGKHTTTRRQMYFLDNGGIVIDNPGIREVGIADSGRGVITSFNDIVRLAKQCAYADCTHTHEPGCAVIDAVRVGELDEGQYTNYLNLKREREYNEMSELEKREKDRQFGKFIKRAKKDIENWAD
jgi:ribosome biogenesis GTPase